ncbi:alpha/beta hydrolase [Pseudomaricurvus hydrocarbonicus]|nr:alpha/beta hydrolase [Aestuariicella hydrocarbonica]
MVSPLIIAIHGGSFTSEYFDIPGYSLFERASALGISVLGIDRPGYGMSIKLDDSKSGIQGQANYLRLALEQAWITYGEGHQGIVLIGHSIGAAIALTIAADNTQLPLLGIAVSGVGLRTPKQYIDAWNNLPGTSVVEMSAALKDSVMFGPAESFTDDMPSASHRANTTALREELLDIVSGWPQRVEEILANIRIPVHYRQAANDRLWVVNQQQLDEFRAALIVAPRVDAMLIADTGHCMDFHRIGAALHIQQLGFALQCAVEH